MLHHRALVCFLLCLFIVPSSLMRIIIVPIFSLLCTVQFSPVSQSCSTLCDSMDCSTTGFPVLHYLLEFAQTRVHRINDANQTSHPLLTPAPPTSIFPSIRVFSNESALRNRWPKDCSFSFNTSLSNELPPIYTYKLTTLQ